MDLYSWIILGRQAANMIGSIMRSEEYWMVYILDEVRPRFEVNMYQHSLQVHPRTYRCLSMLTFHQETAGSHH